MFTSEVIEQIGMVVEKHVERRDIVAAGISEGPFDRGQFGVDAVAGEHVEDGVVAFGCGDSGGRTLGTADGADGVESQAEEVTQDRGTVALCGGLEFVVEELGGFSQPVAELAIPGIVLWGAEAMVDEELEVRGVVVVLAPDAVVVEPLAVVGIGAGVKQERREFESVRVS